MLYKMLLFLHMLSFISWMAGLLYLPRLFVYHSTAQAGSFPMLEVMERRLLKIIMTPAMILTWLFGFSLATKVGVWSESWFLAKLLCLLFLSVFHFHLAHWCKNFARKENRLSERFFRIANEVPTILLILILLLAIFKPF